MICFSIVENEANLEPIREIITKIGSMQQKSPDLIFKSDSVIKETISESQ